ncbi:unnamed protein product [Agarophyton chilense]
MNAKPLSLCAIILIFIRTQGAFSSPIADCDETFNYWEPLHFLLYGYGLQTWEYSPEYCLRSYAFLLPYALVSKFATLIHPYFLGITKSSVPTSPKVFAFYFTRFVQALCCGFTELHLIEATYGSFGPFVAAFLFLFLATSPGLFRSAVEFLPSSFAMICLCLALSAWMKNNHFGAVLCVALASLLGWVYAAALGVPMALHMALQRNGFHKFLRNAIVCGVLVLAIIIPIDSYLYGKLVIAPMNHIWYNVFPEKGTGSHIFGVESWTFYFVNVFLNCNLATLFVTFLPVLLFVGYFTSLYDVSGIEVWRRIVFLSPTYVALAIFVPQPHKEERFLAPCYPYIALIAAVVVSDCLKMLSKLGGNGSMAKLMKVVVSFSIVTVTICAGVSRAFMQVDSFHAPLTLYRELGERILTKQNNRTLNEKEEINICIGKEWYRFPSNFFLPNRRFRIKFVRSSFTGLLPKPFAENGNGTRLIPRGMNPYNREDPEQFFDWQAGGGCHFFVDFDLSHRNVGSSTDETNPIPMHARRVVLRKQFLDSDASQPGYRAFAIPRSHSKLVYGEYQIIQNIDLLPEW